MTHNWSRPAGILVAAALVLAALAPAATAEIRRIGTPTLSGAAPNASANGLAFDDKHNVYLHVWGVPLQYGHVQGRFIAADGTAIGSVFQISFVDQLYGLEPRVAYSSGTSDDVFLVTFSSDAAQADRAKNIYGQLVRFTGTGPQLVGSNFPISAGSLDPLQSQTAGGLTYNPKTGRFLVSWFADRGGDVDAFVRLFNADGTAAGAEINISAAPFWQGAPNVALDPTTNRFLVVYQGEHPTSSLILGSWARLLNGDTAAPIGDLITISTGGFQAQENVLFLPERQAFLTFWTHIVSGSQTDVNGRLVDTDGVPLGTVYGIIATPVFDGAPEGAYNPLTRSALIACMSDYLYVWGGEVDEMGTPVRSFQASSVQTSPTGGSYWPRVTAGNDGQFGLGFTVDYQNAWFERFEDDIVAPLTRPFGDFDGDGKADIITYQPETGTWYRAGVAFAVFGAPGDVPVPGDYDGDGDTDPAVFRPSTGTWYALGLPPVQFGLTGDLPEPADYNGDGVTDIAVFRPATGQWIVRGGSTTVWGVAGDVPVPADYDGDKKADLAVFRPSTGWWFVRYSSNGQSRQAHWGTTGDLPVPGDFKGDGTADLAVYRPSTSTWLIEGMGTYQFGTIGDWPLVLDMDGDTRDEIATYRPWEGRWNHRNLSTGQTFSTQVAGVGLQTPLRRLAAGGCPGDADGDKARDPTVFRPSSGSWLTLSSASGLSQTSRIDWGVAGDIPVAADFDGDGKVEKVIFRPSTGTWAVLWSKTGFTTSSVIAWGGANDIPVVADYDGDGRADAALFRPSEGIWYVLLSSSNYQTRLPWMEWGQSGDIPLAADVDGDRRADLIVFKPTTGTWLVLRSAENYTWAHRITWGRDGDVPVAADYDGDGRAELTIFRPSTGEWFILRSSSGYTTYMRTTWGAAGDIATELDADGDGRMDVGVYRPATGTWHTLLSSSGYTRQLNVRWGATGDVPVWK